MAREIAKSEFRTFARQCGVTFSENFFRSLEQMYLVEARDLIEKYESEAAINGLYYNREDERNAVDTFFESLEEAKKDYTKYITNDTRLPSWDTVLSVDSDFLKRLEEAVEEDDIM